MAGYIGARASVVSSGAERKQTYAITTTTTSLTGLAYTPTKVHVFHNGIRLVDGTDYTATDGETITLTTAAEDGDEVVVISYATFQTSDTVSAANGGTFAGNVEHTGTLTASGDLNAGTIKDASGTNTGLTVSSDGYVLTPNRPSFSVYYDSSTSEGVNGTVVFAGVRHNTGSHYDTSTGKFTAPVAGLYQFNFVGFGSNASGGSLVAAASASVALYSNTNSTRYVISYAYTAGGSHHPNLSFATCERLAAGEEVSITTVNNSLYSDGTDDYLSFSGYLVG